MRSHLIASVVILWSLPASAAVPNRDEQAIRALDEQWVALVAAKESKAIADLYAADGAIMPPNAPPAEGREAIAAAWRDMMRAPGFALTFAPTRVEVSKSGDMAFDRGTYRLVTQGTSGPVEDRGKYVVVWRKADGQWKVAADIFNSDQPARPPQS